MKDRGKISLREISLKDLKTLNKWRNDSEIIKYLGNNFLYIAEEVDESWYENYKKNRDKAIRLSIIYKNEYIGNINLTSIHKINRSAELSIVIGEKRFHGKGFGKQAVQMALAHGFGDLGLNRIYLYVLKNNKVAISLYKKCGFKNEGVKRQEIFKNGAFHDQLIMSILKKDYN